MASPRKGFFRYFAAVGFILIVVTVMDEILIKKDIMKGDSESSMQTTVSQMYSKMTWNVSDLMSVSSIMNSVTPMMENSPTTETSNGTSSNSLKNASVATTSNKITSKSGKNGTSSATDSVVTTSNRTSSTSGKNATSSVPDSTVVAKSPLLAYVTNTTIKTATTIVVGLTGEMGNQLSHLAFGLGVQMWAKEKYDIDTTLKLKAQNRPKWKGAMDATKKCFPRTRGLDFREGNSDAFEKTHKQQTEWLGDDAEVLYLEQCDEKCIEEGLSFLQESLKRNDIPQTNTTFTIPHILTKTLGILETGIIDRYFVEIKEFFDFDNSVCKALPEPDETVFHVRNFLVEMPKRGKNLGFEELNPNKTASELLSHLKKGDKVAITSRVASAVSEYVSALKKKGLVVRVIEGQSGVEDFCFLLRAQKELIGIERSTFARWAAILGDAETARLYMVDSPATRRADGVVKLPRNFINEPLKSRIKFEMYKQE